MEHREVADERVHRLGSDAELVGVLGAEANESWSEEGPTPGWAANVSMQDDRVGDGGSPFWVYEYRTAEANYDVVVAENGTVVEIDEDERDPNETAIDDWEISSVEAAEIVAEHNESWKVRGVGMAAYHLDQDNETSDPTWSLAQIHEDAAIVAKVDATTGEFLGAHPFGAAVGWAIGWGAGWGAAWGSGWSGGWGGGWGTGSQAPPQEGGSFSDSLTVAEPTSEHDFTIAHADHPRLGVALELEEPVTGTVEVTVEGPEGELGSLEANSGSPTSVETWDRAVEGSHTARAELADGVDQGYTVHWCAYGQEEHDDEEAEEACEAVEDAVDDAEDGVRLSPIGG
jgi:hypothetical protein